MVGYTWNGATGSYLDPTQWTPGDVPLYGTDTVATINAGTVLLSSAEPNGITLLFGGPPATSSAGPTLVLNNAALGPDMTLGMSYFGTVEVDGSDANFGTIAMGDPRTYTGITVNSSGFGTLRQYGTVSVGASSVLDFTASTLLDNEGLIQLNGGNINTVGTISGSGMVDLAALHSTMSVLGGVDAGQVFLLEQGNLSVENYDSFHGTLADFSSSAATLSLGGLQFDAATYAADGNGEHLVLSRNGAAVGELSLAGTPATQYTVTQSYAATTITPVGAVYSDGSIPGSITAGAVTIRDAEPNGQVVALGAPGFPGQGGGPSLVLDNAALGPQFLLTVASPDATGSQNGVLAVQGYDANYGEIDVIPSADAQTSGAGNALEIDILPGFQLNQEGTVRIISPQTVRTEGARLTVNGPGTLNNDGQIFVGPGSTAAFGSNVTGSGTITVDHAFADLFQAASTQTVDLLAGAISTSTSFNAAIKDWNSAGQLTFNAYVTSVQFNQTSDAGGDLQLFGGTRQVGDLHLLGTYATSDFTVVPGHTEVSIVASGKAPPAA